MGVKPLPLAAILLESVTRVARRLKVLGESLPHSCKDEREQLIVLLTAQNGYISTQLAPGTVVIPLFLRHSWDIEVSL